jgi:hypothetical protein
MASLLVELVVKVAAEVVPLVIWSFFNSDKADNKKKAPPSDDKKKAPPSDDEDIKKTVATAVARGVAKTVLSNFSKSGSCACTCKH